MRLIRPFLRPWLAMLIRQRSVCRALLLMLAVIGAGYLLGLPLWPCVFADVTGLPCPGCGMTRAASALLRGEWAEAWRFHPFAFAFAVIGLFAAAGAMLPRASAGALAAKVEAWEVKSRLTAIFLAVLLIFSLMRVLGFWYQPPLSRPSLFFLIQEMQGGGGLRHQTE
ncbi:MAG TPA: hypothetical protein DIT13_13495 [Verrucomicrobiales bacterium]|nr:hypothetical protein [Verrucomicrobiales bacterium]HRJ09190.1 DUF2752 domain-containing protein [Prosthecobacter sp.]HRK15805.1 DUF2752 domain-containing protein [Prosthecobacter sp.]